MRPYLPREEVGAIIAARFTAERTACIDVPTEVLETVRVADLLEENAALRALLGEWFEVGLTYPHSGIHRLGIMARTRTALEGESDG